MSSESATGTMTRHMAEPGTRARANWALVVGGVLIGALVLWLRRPGALLGEGLWAEDSWFLYPDSVKDPIGTLFKVYAGQLTVPHRLLALAIADLPPAAIPAAYGAVSLLVTSACAAVVLTRRAAVLFGPPATRVLTFALLILLPGVAETLGNVINLHVSMALAAVLLLCLPAPATRLGAACEFGFLALAATTGAVGVILLPVALVAFLRTRRRPNGIRLAIIAVGAACNVLIVTTSPRTVDPVTLERLRGTSGLAFKRVFGQSAAGQRGIADWTWGATPSLTLFVVIGAAALLMALVGMLVFFDRSGPSWIWLVPGVMWIYLGLQSPGVNWVIWNLLNLNTAASRYFVLAIAAVHLIVGRGVFLAWQSGQGSRWAVAVAALVICSAGAAIDSRVPDHDPPPPQALKLYQQCLQSGSSFCDPPAMRDDWSVVRR